MGFKWQRTPVEAFRNIIDKYLFGIERATQETLQRHSAEIENWMKQTASWQDRTGNARSGLKAEFQQMANQYSLILSHSVYYGQYLEYSFSGKYAILQPAIRFWQPILMRELQEKINYLARINNV